MVVTACEWDANFFYLCGLIQIIWARLGYAGQGHMQVQCMCMYMHVIKVSHACTMKSDPHTKCMIIVAFAMVTAI